MAQTRAAEAAGTDRKAEYVGSHPEMETARAAASAARTQEAGKARAAEFVQRRLAAAVVAREAARAAHLSRWEALRGRGIPGA